MTVFTNGQGESLTNEEVLEIAIMVKIRDSNRIDELPENYSVLGEDQLNFGNSDADGYIDDNGYFQAGSISPGGEAVAILSDDGRIFISFAGTNDSEDLSSILSFGDNSYIDGFESYLETVAEYAEANGYEIALVTGKSLGGAATNMLADSPDVADGAYADATFFAVASPAIADSQHVYNFGYDNDYFYEFYEETFGSQQGDYSTGTDNLILYNSEYADEDWTQFYEYSAHSYNNFERGVEALTDTIFIDELSQDSFVIIGNTNVVDMNLAYERTNSDADDVYFLSPDTREDTVTGTDVNDHIETGAWADTINSGDGNDVIYSGAGADVVNAGNGDDYVNAGNYHDVIHGDDGDDTIFGASGNDALYGDAGNDVLDGEYGEDQLYGGAGDDIIAVGSGDIASGGDDRDTFTISSDDLYSSNTITIDGGTGSTALGDIDDIDSLLLGEGITIVDGTYSVTFDDDMNSYSGTMQITDGETTLTVNFSEIEDIDMVICFARRTEIETDAGSIPVEALKIGDRVKTKDNGFQPIRWIGSKTRRNIHPSIAAKTAPIKISAGALGDNIPSRDLFVSPQHRILINSDIAKRMFGKRQVLVAAKELLMIGGIDQVYDFEAVEYFHFLFDSHEIVFANNAQAESLYTGPEAFKAVDEEARSEILEMFPELETMEYGTPARFIPLGNKSRNLALRHAKNAAPLQ